MAYIDFAGITVPTPTPYNRANPTENQENFCFVMLQVMQLLKNASFKVPDKDQVTTDGNNIKTAIENLNLSVPAPDLEELTQAIKDLQYNDNVIDFGVFRIELRGKYKET